ncbi:MAG: phage holin family protein [Clostridia bacterium]|nr:phage holin family protein [Clostridia bacterium]
MDIMQYITKEALILIPVLWVIGYIIKSIPNIANWIIPIVVIVLGAILGLVVVSQDVNGVIQGILAGAASVGLNQVKRQAEKQT